MTPFEYVEARNLDEVPELLAAGGETAVLAGGVAFALGLAALLRRRNKA